MPWHAKGMRFSGLLTHTECLPTTGATLGVSFLRSSLLWGLFEGKRGETHPLGVVPCFERKPRIKEIQRDSTFLCRPLVKRSLRLLGCNKSSTVMIRAESCEQGTPGSTETAINTVPSQQRAENRPELLTHTRPRAHTHAPTHPRTPRNAPQGRPTKQEASKSKQRQAKASKQLINQSVNQSNKQTTTHSNTQTRNQSTIQSFNQSIINQSIHQSIDRSINQSINQSLTQSINQ